MHKIRERLAAAGHAVPGIGLRDTPGAYVEDRRGPDPSPLPELDPETEDQLHLELIDAL
ncbi:MAG: hypothetical protein ACYDC1_11680 [Limisphaerales bacterium]